jgi:5-methylcytosine-specific restriction endonuclease McrA
MVAVGKQWRAANPEKVREHNARRKRRDDAPEKKAARAEYKRQWYWKKRGFEPPSKRVPKPKPGTALILSSHAWRGVQQLVGDRPGSRLFIDMACECCGTRFVLAPGTPTTRYCSVLCRKRMGRRRRRALECGPIHRSTVLLRDNGRCQLCGLAVDMMAKIPNDFAFVIDHVLPLARGGLDTMDNVQTAHFICNSEKRDMTMDEWEIARGRSRASA